MRKGSFFPKLAFGSIVRNHRFYYPFMLASAIMAAMFYDLLFILTNEGLNSMGGARTVTSMLFFGMFVVAIFALIFMLYTNGFLMKQRKRELGLYNILGMDKRNLRRLMAWESLFSYIGSVLIGLIAGVLLSKLMQLLLYKLLSFSVPFGFSISLLGIIGTLALFAAIFIICFIYNLICVARAKPVELLHGSQVGEREPKAKILLFVFGLLTLGAGYYMAATIDKPIAAIALFFVAVILVIIGTYSLFTAGSVSILKMLRANKKFYYKPKHFTTISGMIYRMKQNAAGLASICILSTMVLVMISTTVCMYVGIEDQLDANFPRDISVHLTVAGEGGFPEELVGDINGKIADEGHEVSGGAQSVYLNFAAQWRDGEFVADDNHFTTADPCATTVITAYEYNKFLGADISVPAGQVALARSWDARGITQTRVLGIDYGVSETLEWRPLEFFDNIGVEDFATIIVSDDAELLKIYRAQLDAYGDYASEISWYYVFDMSGTDAQKIECAERLYGVINDRMNKTWEYKGHSISVLSRQGFAEDFYGVYGGLLFIGIFLGALFVMATALIIYYKQISEGYDDRRRFEIMQNVGMSKTEVRKSITSQIVMVFFLPLAAACVHLAFAFNMIFEMLKLFQLNDIKLFAMCTGVTILVFAACYAIIYALTARSYYKIVRG